MTIRAVYEPVTECNISLMLFRNLLDNLNIKASSLTT